MEVEHLSTFQSRLTSIPCYRMFPQYRLGAGAFTVLFKNSMSEYTNKMRLPDVDLKWIYTNNSQNTSNLI